jgi:NADH-quinone oxidoreductase subunit G
MAEEIKKEAPANFKVTIDNITVEVAPGTTILNAARQIGGDVTPPAMCYYSKLKDSGGKCRTCLVEVAAGSTADPQTHAKTGGQLPYNGNGWYGSKKYNQ